MPTEHQSHRNTCKTSSPEYSVPNDADADKEPMGSAPSTSGQANDRSNNETEQILAVLSHQLTELAVSLKSVAEMLKSNAAELPGDVQSALQQIIQHSPLPQTDSTKAAIVSPQPVMDDTSSGNDKSDESGSNKNSDKKPEEIDPIDEIHRRILDISKQFEIVANPNHKA